MSRVWQARARRARQAAMSAGEAGAAEVIVELTRRLTDVQAAVTEILENTGCGCCANDHSLKEAIHKLARLCGCKPSDLTGFSLDDEGFEA